MTKDVISVDVNDSMQDAARLIRKHKIKRLPVMENGELVGREHYRFVNKKT
jgi:CBS domain-containing protein